MVAPKLKAVDPPPNAGLVGVTKLDGAVAAVAAPAKLKGVAEELDAGAVVAGLPPKLKGLGAAAVELKVDWGAGA